MGLSPDPDTGKKRPATTERKFAILSKMPTPGSQYYPVPYYMSIFRDSWFDIYRLIGIGKRFMIKNTRRLELKSKSTTNIGKMSVTMSISLEIKKEQSV